VAGEVRADGTLSLGHQTPFVNRLCRACVGRVKRSLGSHEAAEVPSRLTNLRELLGEDQCARAGPPAE